MEQISKYKETPVKVRMVATSFDEYSLKSRMWCKRNGENILQMHFLFVQPENKGLKLTFKMIKKIVKGAL